MVIYYAYYATNTTSSSSSSAVQRPDTNTTAEPVLTLELLAFHCSRGGGGEYAIAEGQVKNTSPGPLRSVLAVVTFYDKKGMFITSDSSLIDFRPLLPNQVSAFKVYATWNPAMQNTVVEFKEHAGGKIMTTGAKEGLIRNN